MFKTLQDVEQYLIEQEICKTVVLCGAHDSLALSAVVEGKRKNIVTPILIGNSSQIEVLLKKLGESPAKYEIINECSEDAAANLALRYVYEGKADIPMKGLLQSSAFIAAMSHPIRGLMDYSTLLSEATVFYFPPMDRLLFLADCAINVSPGLEEKEMILKNTIGLAKAFGICHVNVAVLSAVEKETPNIISSVDAARLAERNYGEDVTVSGPFALDNALDLEAARHKGITNPVAGNADILLVPELVSGNFLHKAVHFFGHYEYASVMLGTKSPVVFNSRTDDARAKYYSILAAILQTL